MTLLLEARNARRRTHKRGDAVQRKSNDWVMMERIEELRLNQSYSFYVTVESNGTHFAGELALAPTACSLTIRGDVLQDRSPDFPYDGIDELTCESFEGTFILYGLKPMGAHNRALQHFPTSIWHFERKYSVSKVIFVHGSVISRIAVQGIEIDSRSISQWVGSTTTQDEIVQKYDNGTLFSSANDIPDEFEHVLGDPGTLRIVYKPSTHYSGEVFSMGLRFPPVLLQTFNTSKSGIEVIECFRKIETIFSFLIGHPLDIQSIRLINKDGRRYRLSLYLSRGPYVESERSRLLFPLGRNLRINHMGLPEFPLDSLTRYFELPGHEQRYFEKYLKYRQMENPEERFLGFFRLLEKLCFQKDFFVDENRLNALINRAKPFLIRHFDDSKNVSRLLKGIPRLNSSKLNTAGCILKFLKLIPSDLLDIWIYGPSDIEPICKIRNDLSHANEFEPEEFEMDRKAKFIEVLLIIRLLWKIGVSIEVGASIVPRIIGHDLIRRPVEPVVTSTGG
ncbi:ApeA N-terminal domain 1-containing protein [Burkholderia pseudomallei]|uniref:ApeA N-terminal domain 1-containing protein n=1 Tax=Burkholderia pseudomallei TaxID=28450 RepID=UPI004064C35D